MLLAIAKVAYPYPAALDDRDRVHSVSVAAVAEYLNHLVERLDEEAEDRDADAPELVEVWRTWDELRQIRAEALRMSSNDRLGLVKKVCGALENEGLLSSVNDDDGGTWRATPRFRVLVTDLVEDSSLYSELYEITHGDTLGGPREDGRS